MDWSLLTSPFFQFLLIIFLAVLFGVVTGAVSRNQFLAEWDIPFGKWAIAKNSPRGYKLFRLITDLGSYRVVRLGTLILGVGLLIARDWVHLVMLIGVFGTTMIADHFIKPMVPRLRPDFPQNFLYYDSTSYPSGHTMLGTAFYLMSAYLAWMYISLPVGRWLVTILAAIAIFLIGFSRIYLGVHFLTDVIGGWLAGSMVFMVILFMTTLVSNQLMVL